MTRMRFVEQGFECPEVYGDPGLLLPMFVSPATNVRWEIGVVPHYVDLKIARAMFGGDPRIRIIDVFKPIDHVVEEISSSAAILSSSLHGLVVAHACGVPAAWLEFSKNLWGDGTKFIDHLTSLSMHETPDPQFVEKALRVGDLKGIVADWPQPSSEKIDRTCRALLSVCPFSAREPAEDQGASSVLGPFRAR